MSLEEQAPSDPPAYRLRLFLSVDLVGSTAFKSKQDSTNLVWIKAFQRFYQRFPKIFRSSYDEFCQSSPEIDDFEKKCRPTVWKTIGDEILFVNRVYSVAHLAAYVSAFRQALISFGEEISASDKLDTKGNAWIAAFPTPNRSIHPSLADSDPLDDETSDMLTEKMEADVDERPSKYDFLGKGIDGGFRISRNSVVDAMTLSPALAYLLCMAKRNIDTTKFDCEFQFHEPQIFKGVVGGRKYPVITLVTSRDAANAEIDSLEAELLEKPKRADHSKLFDYLKKYIEVYEIEAPALKLTFNSADVSPPDHYQNYITNWRKDAAEVQRRKDAEKEAAEASDNGSASAQQPAMTLDELWQGVVNGIRTEPASTAPWYLAAAAAIKKRNDLLKMAEGAASETAAAGGIANGPVDAAASGTQAKGPISDAAKGDKQ